MQVMKQETDDLRQIMRIKLNTLTRNINKISSLRKQARADALKRAKNNLYQYLKFLNYGVIDRNFLNSFFSDSVSKRARRRVLKVILNELIKEGKIKKTTKTKTLTFFRTSTLYSNDYGSYAVLMEKNKHKPRYKQGVYSISSLSIRKVKQNFIKIGYEVV